MNENDDRVITLKRSELNSVLMMLSLGNKSAVDAAWKTIQLFKEGEE